MNAKHFINCIYLYFFIAYFCNSYAGIHWDEKIYDLGISNQGINSELRGIYSRQSNKFTIIIGCGAWGYNGRNLVNKLELVDSRTCYNVKDFVTKGNKNGDIVVAWGGGGYDLQSRFYLNENWSDIKWVDDYYIAEYPHITANINNDSKATLTWVKSGIRATTFSNNTFTDYSTIGGFAPSWRLPTFSTAEYKDRVAAIWTDSDTKIKVSQLINGSWDSPSSLAEIPGYDSNVVNVYYDGDGNIHAHFWDPHAKDDLMRSRILKNGYWGGEEITPIPYYGTVSAVSNNGTLFIAWSSRPNLVKVSRFQNGTWSNPDTIWTTNDEIRSLRISADVNDEMTLVWLGIQDKCSSPSCVKQSPIQSSHYEDGEWGAVETVNDPSITKDNGLPFISSSLDGSFFVLWQSMNTTFLRQAHIGAGSFDLTLIKTGSGTITSSPSGINCGSTCSASFNSGTSVTLTATPDANYIFNGWSGDCSGNGACTLTMNEAKSVSAVFAAIPQLPVNYSLSVSKSGSGTITSVPARISCGSTCSGQFLEGFNVSLIAQPDYGYAFAGWSGACAGTGTCVVTMNGDKSASANFIELPKYPVTVTKPSTGVISSEPAGILCGGPNKQCSSSFTSAKLTATPNAGYEFIKWNGCQAPEGNVCYIKPTGKMTVSAVFKKLPKYTVKITKNNLGSITSSPGGLNCPDKKKSCSVKFIKGTQVTLTPVAQAGRSFLGWSSACSGTDTCTLLIDGNKGVGATFQ